jgi:hypothetical protein
MYVSLIGRRVLLLYLHTSRKNQVHFEAAQSRSVYGSHLALADRRQAVLLHSRSSERDQGTTSAADVLLPQKPDTLLPRYRTL